MCIPRCILQLVSGAVRGIVELSGGHSLRYDPMSTHAIVETPIRWTTDGVYCEYSQPCSMTVSYKRNPAPDVHMLVSTAISSLYVIIYRHKRTTMVTITSNYARHWVQSSAICDASLIRSYGPVRARSGASCLSGLETV